MKDLDRYNPALLRQFTSKKGWMLFTERVIYAKEHLVCEFYANISYIRKGTKVTKVCNLKVRFDQHTLNAYLGFKD